MITEYSSGLPAEAYLQGIATGADGSVWVVVNPFTMAQVNPTTGSITTTPMSLGAHSLPMDLVAGPDGNLWFTDAPGSAVGTFDLATRQASEYTSGLQPNGVSTPEGITVGPDGNLWFTDPATGGTGTSGTPAVGTIDPTTHVITEFTAGLNAGSSPQGIVSGPDGNLWFADQGTTPAIGVIDPATHAITEFSAGLNSGSRPAAIAAGPDGDLWFTDQGTTPAIGRIDPTTHTITEYSTGLLSFDSPQYIVAGADGNLWFTDYQGTVHAIGRIDPETGAISEFTDGNVCPTFIAAGPVGSNSLWFSDICNGGAVGRVLTGGPTAVQNVVFSPSSVAPQGTSTWGVSFQTSASGSLTVGGAVYLGGPTGTAFPPGAGDYQVDGAVAAAVYTSGDTVQVDVPGAVSASATVQLTVTGVTNPGAGSYPASDFSVSTSADTEAANPSLGLAFGSGGAPSAGAPAVSGVSPRNGPTSGGTSVTIDGSGLGGATAVAFGSGHPATAFNVVSANEIDATAPPGTGTVDVQVTTPAGTSAVNQPADQFTYVVLAQVTGLAPDTGALGAGTSVTISGSGFTAATGVEFGQAKADFTVVGDGTIVATAPPANAAGTVDVVVQTANGQSAFSAADRFTYFAPVPAVTGIQPAFGPDGGGSTVTITGSGFWAATAVYFGTTPVTGSMQVVSDGEITVTLPADDDQSGTVAVVVFGPGGASPATPAAQFSYAPHVSWVAQSFASSGQTIDVFGYGLAVAQAVYFGSVQASRVTVVDDTHLQVVVPPAATGAGSVDLTVVSPAGTSQTSSSDQFTYTGPQIEGFSIAGGAAGRPIAIYGRGFTYATAVDFGPVDLTGTQFTIVSDGVIDTTLPTLANSGTVDVSVVGPSGTSPQAANTTVWIGDFGSISGTVATPGSDSSGTEVWACFVGGVCDLAPVAASGTYSMASVPDGSFVLNVYPGYDALHFANLMSASTPVTMTGTEHLVVNFTLQQHPPFIWEGTFDGQGFGGQTFGGDVSYVPGHDHTVLARVQSACADEEVDWVLSLRYTFAGGHSSVTEQGELLPGQVVLPGVTDFVGTIDDDQLFPGATGFISLVASCDGTVVSSSMAGELYFDPSGTVETPEGQPIAGATVTLENAPSFTGPFAPIPQGSAVMAPDNRTNPGTTDATGIFHWDVVGGYYEVIAQKPGCSDPLDPSASVASTQVLLVPPPQTGLTLHLDCPGAAARTSSTTTLTAGSVTIVSGQPFILTAQVQGHSGVPAGVVTFSDGGTVLGSAPIDASDGQAMLVLPSLATGSHSIVASYGGDAANLPSQSSPLSLGVAQAAVPTVTGLSPASGPAGGVVTIDGSGFIYGGTSVDFGAGNVATPVDVLSATQVAVTVPAGSGTVDVTVTTAGGTSSVGAADRFTYGAAGGGAGTGGGGGGGGGGATGALSTVTSGPAVGPAGGTLTSTDGSFTLTVPAGLIPAGESLSVATSRTVPSGTPALPQGFVAVSPVITLSGATLSQAVPATLDYTAPAGQSAMTYTDGAWQYLPSSLAASGGAASFYVTGPGTFVVLAVAADFQDVPGGYWAQSDIQTLVAAGVVGGFPDGTFRPDGTLTRAQFVKMLDLTLNLPAGSASAQFSDVPSGAWYAPYVAAAAAAGLVQGTSATTFSPDATVTREQLAVLLSRALKLTGTTKPGFTDDAQIAAWAQGGVAAAAEAGLLNGFPDGSFRPLGPTTRAQAAKVLARVIAGMAPKSS